MVTTQGEPIIDPVLEVPDVADRLHMDEQTIRRYFRDEVSTRSRTSRLEVDHPLIRTRSLAPR